MTANKSILDGVKVLDQTWISKTKLAQVLRDESVELMKEVGEGTVAVGTLNISAMLTRLAQRIERI